MPNILCEQQVANARVGALRILQQSQSFIGRIPNTLQSLITSTKILQSSSLRKAKWHWKEARLDVLRSFKFSIESFECNNGELQKPFPHFGKVLIKPSHRPVYSPPRPALHSIRAAGAASLIVLSHHRQLSSHPLRPRLQLSTNIELIPTHLNQSSPRQVLHLELCALDGLPSTSATSHHPAVLPYPTLHHQDADLVLEQRAYKSYSTTDFNVWAYKESKQSIQRASHPGLESSARRIQLQFGFKKSCA